MNIEGFQIIDFQLSILNPSPIKEGGDLDLQLTFSTNSDNDRSPLSTLDNFIIKFKGNCKPENIIPLPKEITPEENTSSPYIYNYFLRWRAKNMNPSGPGAVTAYYSSSNTDESEVDDPVFVYVEREQLTRVSLETNATPTDQEQAIGLWLQIYKSTKCLSFDNYNRYMQMVLCGEGEWPNEANPFRKALLKICKKVLPFTDIEAYRYLKIATEAFMMAHCGIPLCGNDGRSFNDRDLQEINKRLILINGPTDLPDLQQRFWSQYLKTINGSSDCILPYFSLIYQKLSDQTLKRNEIGKIIGCLCQNNSAEISNGNNLSDFCADERQLADSCAGIISQKLTSPCFIELIWSYWMEEGMLVQSLNAICQRFQNIRRKGNDPLASMEISPLRLINNLLWGYIQDDQHRLTVRRRAYEYDHHYGISLKGAAVPNLQSADSRTRFMESFHNLLSLTTQFYKQADDTTVIADGFPILNAIKEVHLILSEGAHNQFGDLPSTARIEMMMQQWIISRPEFREILPTRTMVAYPEPWMDRIAAMNTLQGWTDANMLHFLNLAVFGEQILLSIRYGAWSEINDRNHAANWANFWREQIQGYIYAYRGVTGVDLSATTTTGKIDSRPPSYHLARRLKERQNGQLAKPSSNGKAPRKGGVKKEWF